MPSPSKGYKEVNGVVIIEDDVDDVIFIDDETMEWATRRSDSFSLRKGGQYLFSAFL